MIIYEKENKLNINFEDKIGDPDFSIYKNNEDKVVISSNGTTSEPGSSSGGGGVMHVSVEVSGQVDAQVYTLSKTYNEIKNAAENSIVIIDFPMEDDSIIYTQYNVVQAAYYDNVVCKYCVDDGISRFESSDPDGYPACGSGGEEK